MRFHFFSQPHPTGNFNSIWEIFPDKAVRIGIPNAETSKNCYCVVKPDQLATDAICELLNKTGHGECSHWPLTLDPGQYYPRMARPSDQHPHQSPGHCPGAQGDAHVIAMALGQLNVLTRLLTDICQTIHPTQSTLDTYGHAIRNLLILACTEVETHWRGILVANDFIKKRYTTDDYVQLLNAMQLDGYAVGYPYYPWLGKRRPFQGWNNLQPTQSLSWYNAYNSVKHDREMQFSQATLGHAFDALSACAIMMFAQYGYSIPGWHGSDTSRFFDISEQPSWKPSEVYTMDYKSIWAGQQIHIPVKYPFRK